MKPIYFNNTNDSSTETRFFEYSQNNSGGDFVYDLERGIGHYVIVEAYNGKDADRRARSIGLYFDGVRDCRDCDCCGDRWSEAYGKGTPDPSHYGEALEMAEDDFRIGHVAGRPYVFVHYIDGRVIGWA